MKYLKHFITITRHKFYVMIVCIKAGIFWQGIAHDLSKYSISEFVSSAKYFQGNSSPITKEKNENGYSFAWQHHKGRNKHHWEYWTDFKNGELVFVKIPPKYLIEMICDWIGAGKAYNKGNWTIETLRSWYYKNEKNILMHKSSKNYIELMVDNILDEMSLYSWLDTKAVAQSYALDELSDSAIPF